MTDVYIGIDIPELDNLPLGITTADIIEDVLSDPHAQGYCSLQRRIFDTIADDGDLEDVFVDRSTGELHNYDILQQDIRVLDQARIVVAESLRQQSAGFEGVDVGGTLIGVSREFDTDTLLVVFRTKG